MSGGVDVNRSNEFLTLMMTGASGPSITTPIKVALMSVTGSDSAAGTEVTGGSYARQTATWAAASGGSVATNATLTYSSMPAITVTAVEIYDSTGTPKREFWGPLTSSKTTNSGDTLTIASGSLTVSLA